MLLRRILTQTTRSVLERSRAEHCAPVTGARHFSAPPSKDNFVDPFRNKHLEDVFPQNEAWRQERLSEDPAYFEKLGSKHKPRYLWIGCADARVPANELMGEGAGSVFVHRNVGNQVLNTDISLMSTLQYAVDHLQIPHIIVCGHYDCGAVKAASSNTSFGSPLDNWLMSLRDVKRLHGQEMAALPMGQARERRLVELNVVESCLNLFKTPTVQKRRVLTYMNPDFPYTSPRIHALVFDPSVGRLKRLHVNFQNLLDEHGDVYDVYGKNSTPLVLPKPESLRRAPHSASNKIPFPATVVAKKSESEK